jgi:hypothetical protein
MLEKWREKGRQQQPGRRRDKDTRVFISLNQISFVFICAELEGIESEGEREIYTRRSEVWTRWLRLNEREG